MIIGTNGILINEHGRILLIRRNDTRTYAPPGGGVEAGELPPDNIIREMREETGLITMPIRLVSLSYWPISPDGHLAFTFRMLQRGGDLQTSPESPVVGFFATKPLPSPMANIHQHRVEQAAHHAGGPANWWTDPVTWWQRGGLILLRQGVYRWYDWQRKLKKEPPFIPSPSWQVRTIVIVRHNNGSVLWSQQEGGQWTLPEFAAQKGVAPWDTAVTTLHKQTGLSVTLQALTGVYIHPQNPTMLLAFTAVPPTHVIPNPNQYQWFPADAPPPHHHALHQTAVTHSATTITQFHHIP
jgi:ADP-ribose pyrophosphatase YjhB (NUDIX family)